MKKLIKLSIIIGTLITVSGTTLGLKLNMPQGHVRPDRWSSLTTKYANDKNTLEHYDFGDKNQQYFVCVVNNTREEVDESTPVGDVVNRSGNETFQNEGVNVDIFSSTNPFTIKTHLNDGSHSVSYNALPIKSFVVIQYDFSDSNSSVDEHTIVNNMPNVNDPNGTGDIFWNDLIVKASFMFHADIPTTPEMIKTINQFYGTKASFDINSGNTDGPQFKNLSFYHDIS